MAETKPQRELNFGGGRRDNHGLTEKARDSRGTLRRLARYFAGEQYCLLIGVALDNAEQDIEALAYLADGLPVNGNF